MVTLAPLHLPPTGVHDCGPEWGGFSGESASLVQSALDTALCADGFVSPRGRWFRRIPPRRPSFEWPPADDSPGYSPPHRAAAHACDAWSAVLAEQPRRPTTMPKNKKAADGRPAKNID